MGRRKYDKKFKEEAVKLVMGDRSVKEVSDNLGISPFLLAKWKCKYRAHGQDAFPGQGRLMPQDEEMR